MALTKVSTGMINTSAASVDLDIDNGTFYIDVNSGRVGVSNSSPATALDVTGTATATLFSGSGASLTSIPNAALDNSSITINSYSTSLGGTVTLSTSDVGEGTNLYYTDARADARVSLIVDAAPETLNTLNELAAALGDDANFSTTVTNSIATKLPLAGGTLTGSLSLGDNVKAQFGAGNDLQIYHTGSASVIADSGDGSLFIQGESQIVLGNVSNIESYAIFNADGAVQLRHNNAQKFATTTTGIDITGTATAAAFETDAGGTFTTASGNDLNIVYPASRSLFIKEGSETHVTVDNVGNVGIGATPNTKLHVSSAVTTKSVVETTGTSSDALIEFTKGQGSGNTWSMGLDHSNSSAFSLAYLSNGSPSLTTHGLVTVDTSGNVGIGTDSPNQLLHLSGNGPVLALGSSGTSDPRIDFYDQSTTTIGAGIFLDQDQDTLRILRTVSGSATDGIAINASGNVGIGTASPDEIVHIQGSSAAPSPVVKIQSHDTANATSSVLLMSRLADNVNKNLYMKATLGNLAITGDSGYGNVGIGTDTPNTTLELGPVSALVGPTLRLSGGTGGTSGIAEYPFGTIEFFSNDPSGDGAEVKASISSLAHTGSAAPGGEIALSTTNSGASSTLTERFRITHDGNVGIGTDSPGRLLDLRTNTTSVDPLLLIRQIGTGDAAMSFQTTTDPFGFTIGVDGSDADKFKIGTGATSVSAATKFTIDNTGNVGIGTDSPDFKLHVSHDGGGDASFTGGILVENTGTPAGEPNLAFKNQDTGSNYWFTGLNQDTNYALTYGPTFEDPYNLFTLTSGGNLGVGGDPDPDERLVVTGSANGGSTAIVVQNEYSLASSVDESTDLQFRFYSAQTDNYTSGAMIRSTKTEDWITTADASAELVFYTRENNALAPKMTILPSGNVGIGDTSPDFKLAIRTPAIPSGSTYVWPLDLSRSNTDSRGLSFGIGESRHAIGAHNADITLGQTFGLDSNSLPQFYETMRVWHDGTASAGRVGIGTTSPVTNLHVKAAGNATGPTDVLTIETSRGDVGTAFTGGSIVFVNSDTNSAGQARIKVGSANDAAPIGLNEENSQSFIFETSTGGNIATTNIDGNATTITVTHAAYTLVVGQRVAITAGTYAGSYTIDTVLSNTQFTIADTAHDLAADTTTRVLQFGIPTDSMIIRADGNVGIGTNTPDGKLEVTVTEGDPGLLVSSTSQDTIVNKTQTIQCMNQLSGSNVWQDVAFVDHSCTLSVIGKSIQSNDPAFGGASATATVSVQYGVASVTHHHQQWLALNGGDVTGNIEYRYLNSGASSGAYRLQVRMPYSAGTQRIYTSITGISFSYMFEDN